MKSRSRKNKGARLQNWVAAKISELLGVPWGKDELIRAREMGQSGVDVVLLGRALELMPVSIECKNQEKYSLPAWIKQAKDNQISGTNWLLFCKRNREEPIVVMSAELFFELYKKGMKSG